MTLKRSALLDSVALQPHQQRLSDEAAKGPLRKLLMWNMGSGKSLGSLGAAESHGEPYSVIVPAALRSNYHAEREKFTDEETPADVMSYSELALGKRPQYPDSLVFDEAQRLRNQGSASTQAALDMANQARQVVLLSGTPVVNHPSELATPLSMLTGKRVTPEEFSKRYVKTRSIRPSFLQRLRGISPGEEEDITRQGELKSLLEGKVDYYSPDRPVVPVKQEEHEVEMGPEQGSLYQAMWGKLPFYMRWKLKHDFPLSSQELVKMRSFMSGPRMVSLSTLPFQKERDPLKAYEQSPKLQKAMGLLKDQLADPRKKALVFANYIDAGLTPYSAALTREGIPNAVFHGGLDDKSRQELVDNYNQGKIRVALIGPSGTEGLSFKGTALAQLLDPAWNSTRGHQAEGRGLRYDSHLDVPEDLKNVTVQRFISKLPPTLMGRLAQRIGLSGSVGRPAADDYLRNISARKDRLNKKFLDLLKQVGSQGKTTTSSV